MAGAPKGNTNALKWGLYAQHFNDEQRKGLKRMHWRDERHEIFMHRTIGEDLFIHLQSLLSMPVVDLDQVVKIVNILANNTTTIGTSSRTHAILNGEDPQMGDALSEALGDFNPFEDDRKD